MTDLDDRITQLTGLLSEPQWKKPFAVGTVDEWGCNARLNRMVLVATQRSTSVSGSTHNQNSAGHESEGQSEVDPPLLG